MKLLRGLLAGAYPFLIFAGLRWLEPRWVALGIAGVLALRALVALPGISRAALRRLAAPAAIVAAVVVPTLLTNDPGALLFAPVWMNAALLFAFARTLRGGGPTLVETFARLKDPELSDAKVRHCRHFTIAWCVFFAANAGVCTALALRADLWAWTLYTGFVSYVPMGALFAAEVGVRYWRFRNYQGSLFEPLFRRLFPTGPRP